MKTSITSLRALSDREARFADHLAVFDDPAAAYLASGECSSASRASVRQMAYAMRARPWVSARVTELRNQIAVAGPQATRAALVRDLQEAADVDVREIVNVTRHHCPHCYSSDAYAAAWPILAAQCLDGGSIDLPPEPLCVGQFDHTRAAWADCASCRGAGVAVTHWTPFDQLSPAARRLLRGVELYGDGALKKVVVADVSAIREQLNRTVPGFYAPTSSVALNLHAEVKPLKRGMSVEEALAIMQEVAPVTDDDSTVVSTDP